MFKKKQKNVIKQPPYKCLEKAEERNKATTI